MKLPDPVAQYLGLIKLGLAATLLLASFIGGCRHGESLNADQVADLNRQLGAANASLAGAGRALERVNAEATRRKAEAEAAAKRADEATRIADQAEQRRADAQREWQRRLHDAQRRPGCQALLDTDLEAVCAL